MSEHRGTDKILTRADGQVRWLIFNQPEKRNAISLAMSVRAQAVVEEFAADDTARVLIVTGAGEEAFVSGADISEFEQARSNAASTDAYADATIPLFTTLRQVEKPTIAMIHGYCFGGGMLIAASCDLRFCSDDARFAVPAARLGIGYRFDLTQMIMNIVGPAFTKELLYTAERIDAAKALRIGLVNEFFPKAELDARVRATASTIAANAPLSHRTTKVAVAEALKDPAERDLARCDQLVATCADSEDFRNARRAFMEKRKPVFAGR